MSVQENLQRLTQQLPPGVTLVAVSKTKPAEQVLAAYAAGQRDFGENYVQELADKQAVLPGDIRWHFIGHLQKNKVKYIAPFVHLIHGVDSASLLKEINKQGEKVNRVIDVLLQLHVAQEETKFGLSFEECADLLADPAIAAMRHVKIKGLMAMASNTDNTEQVKKEFLSVKGFSESRRQDHPDLQILSYGMSGDYALAIETGSNMVRIGSLIFGERSKQ